jgi:hypothetical protein
MDQERDERAAADVAFINARRMMICLATFRTEAWKAVALCGLSCWTRTARTHPLTLIFLALSMGFAQPPWHAIAFEAVHPLVGDVEVPRVVGKLAIAASGGGIALISVVEGEIIPFVLGGLGAACGVLSVLESSKSKVAPIYEGGKKGVSGPRAVRYAGALTFAAWSVGAYAEFDDVWAVQLLSAAGAVAFLSEMPVPYFE